MPGLTVETVELKPGQRVVVRAVSEKQVPVDPKDLRTTLGRLRTFVRKHAREIVFLQGSRPDDGVALLMDSREDLPPLITDLRRCRVPREQIVRVVAGVLRTRTHSSEEAGDVSDLFVRFMADVAETIPAKRARAKN